MTTTALSPAQAIILGDLATKTTADLTAGDRIILPDTDAKGFLLPISADNPGTTLTVDATPAPWILTAGPRAGQQARQTGRNGAPLLAFTASGRPLAGTATYAWAIAA